MICQASYRLLASISAQFEKFTYREAGQMFESLRNEPDSAGQPLGTLSAHLTLVDEN
jgi:hypothetical protein